tara:strand:- start:502 stop:633 length:132 start_codon:yes stop_codon:yes gene_type:complete
MKNYKNAIYFKMRKYGPIAVFMFFLIKGLLWLVLPVLGWYYVQ